MEHQVVREVKDLKVPLDLQVPQVKEVQGVLTEKEDLLDHKDQEVRTDDDQEGCRIFNTIMIYHEGLEVTITERQYLRDSGTTCR